MARHVIVDGSNIATEGRSKPSLKQLNDAVVAFMAENPKDVITVVVDATFGHRIDRKEVAEFDEAVANNELVAPPAGTVGRGDAFVLMIAQKVGASILSNDSYQEFHGQYPWLFHEGRLIGGKPVPHVGWVFVTRTPVRGEKSRRSVQKAAPKVSAEAMKPMPVPKSPPPGAAKKKPGKTQPTREAAKNTGKQVDKDVVKAAKAAAPSNASKAVNDVIPFLSFLEKHPVGSSVKGRVESYSSHGAYVQIGDVKGYVPLRLISDPPPRSAREVMAIGDEVSLEVVSVVASRRSIDLKPSVPKTDGTKKAAATKATPGKKATKKVASAKTAAPAKTAAKKSATVKSPAKKAAPAKKTTKKVASTKKAAPAKTVAKKSAAVKSPAKKAAPTKTVKKAPAKKTSAKAASGSGRR
ncbi:MAG: S1 RNA-binding domain-containing protein [Actinomycetota bacterium]|nr:S1 RNA-binding domain-containing protein [Actinomycetota bacterium]MDA2971027.1 S1 RNA-binding domain-containing protein [Actinomycetota bacterium]MDA3000811.1 S1 RNA-binding domain-containing protein [Actinomycetota bacterium]